MLFSIPEDKEVELEKSTNNSISGSA